MTLSPSSVAAPIGTTARTSAPAPGRRVVDAPTRMFHWLFALTFVGAYLTADGERWRLLHETLGYAFGGLAVFRVLYGLVGPRHARLGSLWRRVAGTRAWLRSLRSPFSANWRRGGSLGMALAVVAMLALVAPLVLSGYGTHADWGGAFGGEWLEDVHEFLGDAFLAAVLAHLGLVAGLSLLRRRNLALPMLTGRVREDGPSPVRHDRRWLAALLLLAVVSFGVWQWLDSPRGSMPAGDDRRGARVES